MSGDTSLEEAASLTALASAAPSLLAMAGTLLEAALVAIVVEVAVVLVGSVPDVPGVGVVAGAGVVLAPGVTEGFSAGPLEVEGLAVVLSVVAEVAVGAPFELSGLVLDEQATAPASNSDSLDAQRITA